MRCESGKSGWAIWSSTIFLVHPPYNQRISPENRPGPKRKGSSEPTIRFSSAKMLVSGRVHKLQLTFDHVDHKPINATKPIYIVVWISGSLEKWCFRHGPKDPDSPGPTVNSVSWVQIRAEMAKPKKRKENTDWACLNSFRFLVLVIIIGWILFWSFC